MSRTHHHHPTFAAFAPSRDARLVLPAGLARPCWWCERCEKKVALPEEAGSPAKCPHCRKYTAVWVPEQVSEWVSEPVSERPERKYVKRGSDHARRLFDQMHNAVEDPDHLTTDDTDKTG